MKHELLFLLVENNQSQQKGEGCEDKGYKQNIPRRKRRIVYGIPKNLDKVVKRINQEYLAVPFRHNLERIDNGCHEEESLKYNGQDVLGVPYFYVHDRKYQGKSHRKEKVQDRRTDCDTCNVPAQNAMCAGRL